MGGQSRHRTEHEDGGGGSSQRPSAPGGWRCAPAPGAEAGLPVRDGGFCAWRGLRLSGRRGPGTLLPPPSSGCRAAACSAACRIMVLALGLWAPVRGARMSGARLPRTPVSHIPKCGAAPGRGPPARRVPVLSGFSDTRVSPRRPRAFVSKSLNLHLPRILPACCPHHRILTGAPANGRPSIHLGFPPAAPAPGAASALLCASVTARAGVAQ